MVVVVLFENSIVRQCTFFKYFFMRHGTFVCCLVVVVVLWCLLFVCTSSLRLHFGVCVVGCVNMNCFGCGGFSSSDAP